MSECYYCFGSGVDEEAERAAAPSRCPVCTGKGYLEEEEVDGELDE